MAEIEPDTLLELTRHVETAADFRNNTADIVQEVLEDLHRDQVAEGCAPYVFYRSETTDAGGRWESVLEITTQSGFRLRIGFVATTPEGK